MTFECNLFWACVFATFLGYNNHICLLLNLIDLIPNKIPLKFTEKKLRILRSKEINDYGGLVILLKAVNKNM